MKMTIDELLQKPYWIIDILPKRVPENSPGQFFEVEKYYLEKERLREIKHRHINVVLKLNCYRNVSIDEEAEKKFGFLLNAFKFGPPPHGGIAPGIDRLVMIMSEQNSIREAIAFPKNSFAVSPMDDCPNDVDQKQLDELKITFKLDK